MTLIGGRPVLSHHGRILTSTYCERYNRDGRMHARNQRFARLGVDLFQLFVRGDYPDYYSSRYWLDQDQYGTESDAPFEASLDNQVAAIVQVHPQARFTVGLTLAPPQAWAARNPDHLQRSDDGRAWRAASFASALYLQGQCEFLRRVVRDVQAKPWADRVVGYVMIPHTEGLTEMSVSGFLFDQSPAMQQRFSQFLRLRYADDAALRAAWADEAVTLESARVPTDTQWKLDRAGWLTWPHPRQTQRYRDYFALQRDLLHEFIAATCAAIKAEASRPTVVTIDALKQSMFGWQLLDEFEAAGRGYDYPHLLLANGSYDVARTLDLPQLDGLMTPADYTDRSVGLGFEAEGPGDSLVLRGKIMMLEDDSRSWIGAFKHDHGAWRDAREATAGLWRNSAMAVSRGFYLHWANVGPGYFDHDDISNILAPLVQQRRQLMTQPLGQTEHAIAMIIDDEAPIHGDFTCAFDNLAILRQRNFELSTTGLPYRIHLFSDLQRDDFPRFRAYLFPNLLRLTPQRLQLLRDKVLRDGSIAIFGPATGITDGQTLSARWTSELVGVPLTLLEKKIARRVLVHAGAHAALREVAAPLVYGDPLPYGSVLAPAEPLLPSSATELGRASLYFFNNSAGLMLRETGRGAGPAAQRGPGDAAIVFSLAAPIPAAVLRSLALYAGCVPWSDLGDVVHSDGRFLSVHGIRPGPRTIHLPGPGRLTDLLTQQVLDAPDGRVRIELQSPDTRLFRFEPQNP